MNLAPRISKETGLPLHNVQTVIELLQEGATIPFLARYRKERTGGMDEDQLRTVQSLQETLNKLETRRTAIIKSLEEQGLFSGPLRQAVETSNSLVDLEDLYLPHKPKRRTRATVAKDNGLEPLALLILRQPRNDSPENAARRFIKGDIKNTEDALAGARDIIAELAAEQPDIRKSVRDKAKRFGRLKATKRKNAEDPKEVYRSYYEFEAPINRLQHHQILALDRGEKEKILRVSVELQERDWKEPLRRQYRPYQQSPWGAELDRALDDGGKRLLLPAIARDVRNGLTEMAQEHAIGVFGENLKSLLLVPPLAGQTILALDPGFRSGCKIAVVDPTGKLLATDTIYPHPPQKQETRSLQTLETLIKRFGVTAIAIGNGTASRESELLVAKLNTPYLIVSEAGASVYSASPLAKAEFPDLDVSIRGAISIARRIQDPLAELIKIDPKSVGVGMYQHDLDQNKLSQALSGVVESVVHRVGVELNTASAPLLSHVGGIGPKTAERIIEFRETNGPFPDRATLKKVKGLGPKAFELAAGFIRVRGGKNPLDDTAIHPESYAVAKSVLKLTNGDVKSVPFDQLKSRIDCPEPTLKDILQQLQRPGRDPREDLPKPILRSGVMTMDDLYPGLTLSGTVRNVVDFGAFVDIGVKQDGLIHVSKLKGQRLGVGQVIEVEVLEVDEKRGRISLRIG